MRHGSISVQIAVALGESEANAKLTRIAAWPYTPKTAVAAWWFTSSAGGLEKIQKLGVRCAMFLKYATPPLPAAALSLTRKDFKRCRMQCCTSAFKATR